jgi:SAM-dependent methyltransferase
VTRGNFHDLQRAYTRDANPDHYAWQTRSPYFSESERALLDGVVVHSHERLLEIGCGEGGNLYHLRGQGRLRVGLDFSAAKARFASRNAEAATLCADATHLPFADGSFDVILIRDLLHHVHDRVAVLRQAARVLRQGGRLTLIEPNVLSPLIWLHAALVPAERRVLESTDARARADLARAGLRVVSRTQRQPLPLARVLLHPRLPLPLATSKMLRRFDQAAARFVPERAWLYLVYQAVKA